MKITMTKTCRGTEDGHTVRVFEAGETYDLPDGLAGAFLRGGDAAAWSEPTPLARPPQLDPPPTLLGKPVIEVPPAPAAKPIPSTRKRK